jgi:hypothetical protein
MTHRDETIPDKAELYDKVAEKASLRIAMNAAQLEYLQQYGPSLQIPLPLELEHFTIIKRAKKQRPTVGVSGYVYNGGRKGEALVNQLLASGLGRRIHMTASGRGWPVHTQGYSWADVPKFFQSLDVYLCTSSVEGGPMTTLEALATGCPVVIPRGVGLHDELPETYGIYRYEINNYSDMAQALERALDELGTHNPEALRAATQPHSVTAWVDGNRRAFESFLYDKPAIPALPDWRGRCGIYMVAFGEPSRHCALEAIQSIKESMPDIPVALCSDRRLGPEDKFIQQPDADIGGRIAKLKVYDLAPKSWQYVLYLDADTEVRAPVTFYFDLVQSGWEFVICKDVRRQALMRDYRRPNNQAEYEQVIAMLGTDEALQLNGGVFAFRRCDRTRRFFERWYEEWNKYGARDQGGLIRALYADPPRMTVLGNEWNYFPHYCKHEEPAGIWHFPQRARRWQGQIPGRLDSKAAWAAVTRFQNKSSGL